LAERVNSGEVSAIINDENCIIDNIRSTKISLGSKIIDVRDLIKEDLRAIKQHKPDAEGKKQINTKEEQKAILGRSPDFADTMMMREYFELKNNLIWI
jgi:hypothetical protein